MERREVDVTGIVQGVGFRPFIYSLATRHGLGGWVRNDPDGVHIEVEGERSQLDRFVNAIEIEAPALASVETVRWRSKSPERETRFRIEESANADHVTALVSPDSAICADCERELFDPANRRYRYPFINCVNCGPRFTITLGVPYDRPRTTMAGFEMCADCLREYHDPADRRFHAQPNACPVCGPRVSLLDRHAQPVEVDDPIIAVAMLLRQGAIVAVKGLGGYHLACDPANADAVEPLRERKLRIAKPFAVMARDLDGIREFANVTAFEERLLLSAARPIALLERREEAKLAAGVAPRQRTIGAMIAYTPLHHLLLADFGRALVMTSGNRCDEPIAYVDEEARERLAGIADWYLVHDRPIHIRCDDSVFRMLGPNIYPIRRARGYAPSPIIVADPFVRPILACGGELKNTFCLGRGGRAFLSHHIGDLENWETLRSFREGIEHFERLFDIHPEIVAYDLHPDYLATRYARELEESGMEAIGVQHHHAHIAACLADNDRPPGERAIGVALDGTGYGEDGTIWGGELFEGSLNDGFIRRAHLSTMPLPGGDAATKQPWRNAVAQLVKIYGEEEALRLPLPLITWAGEKRVRQIARLLESGLNTPLTSSAGRLFNAVAALVGVPGAERTTYEGQAAIELEQVCGSTDVNSYPIALADGEMIVIDANEIIANVVKDVMDGRSPGEISARFHVTVAEAVRMACGLLRERSGLNAVALSGGVFQNATLFLLVNSRLIIDGFTVYSHQRVPTNDGGLSLGQAALANARLRGA